MPKQATNRNIKLGNKLKTAPPWLLLGSLVVVVHVVGEGVHVHRVGEGGSEVGVDVVVGERDELAPTPKDLPEEKVCVEGVGEGDEVADDVVGVALIVLLEPEHARRARREVAVAGREEEVC